MCLQAIGAGITAVGKIREGREARKTSEFNAREIENQRINEEKETREDIRRARIRNRKTIAQQKLQAIKSGFRPDVGSPLEILAENAENLEMQIQDEARAQEIRSTRARKREELSIFQGRRAERAGQIGAASTLLSFGASQTAKTGSIFGAG